MKSFRIIKTVFGTAMLCFFLFSCVDQEEKNTGKPHDPSKPVVLESFYPDSGGMATKVIMTGKNFGNNVKDIKVYYNSKRASIVNSNGEQMFVMTPKQPGDTCVISVVVGNDSTVYDRQFRYRTSVTVTTVVGQKGTTVFKGGTIAETTFANPSFLCVDAENNIFLSHWINPYNFVIINQEKNYVAELAATGAANVPAPDANGKVIMVPTDAGYNYYGFDPDAQWAAKRMTILRPTDPAIDFTINYKHGFAACKFEDPAYKGFIYTRAYNGQLLRFNPSTREGELVAKDLIPDSDSYLKFHPTQPTLMYITYPGKHVIYTFDIITKEHKLYAGTLNVSGWRDGDRLEAEFNTPRQLVIDEDGALIVADEYNHCIRKVTPDGMVTTLIGMGGKAGYQDGNPDDALFNRPRGVAIDSEYNVYVADYNNNCIRKLAIE